MKNTDTTKDSETPTTSADDGCATAICSPWFIIYDGSSPDGRGFPQYHGRTKDAKLALKHFKKCNDNPYSTGKVRIVTDREEGLAINEQSFDQFL